MLPSKSFRGNLCMDCTGRSRHMQGSSCYATVFGTIEIKDCWNSFAINRYLAPTLAVLLSYSTSDRLPRRNNLPFGSRLSNVCTAMDITPLGIKHLASPGRASKSGKITIFAGMFSLMQTRLPPIKTAQ